MILDICLIIACAGCIVIVLAQEIKYRNLKRLCDSREKFHQAITRAYYEEVRKNHELHERHEYHEREYEHDSN